MLIVLHQEHSTPGRIGLRLAARGYALDIRKPRFGDPLPETMDGHAGAVVFGGPMSANDPDDFVATETDWMAVPLKEGAPLLGVCLGAQMLCRHLGGTVSTHPDGLVEIGWYPLATSEAGRALTGGDWPQIIYQWHSEGMTLPGDATCLASSEAFGCQAFSYGASALAIQFHVELTQVMIHRWTTRGSHRFALPNAQGRDAHLQGRLLHDHLTRAWLETFLDTWLARDARRGAVACAA
ncbi:MAG: glutamine amidotransferase [Pseudomonadota bacterium]